MTGKKLARCVFLELVSPFSIISFSTKRSSYLQNVPSTAQDKQIKMGPSWFVWVLGVTQLLQILIKMCNKLGQGWVLWDVTGLTVPVSGTVQKGTEQPGRWQSCGMTWCHQLLEMHSPTPKLWALQRNPTIIVLEVERPGGDSSGPPQGSVNSKETPGLCC